MPYNFLEEQYEAMVVSTCSEEHLNYKVSTTESQASVRRWQIAQRNHCESQSSIEAPVWALLNEFSLNSCRQSSIFRIIDHTDVYMYIFAFFFSCTQ